MSGKLYARLLSIDQFLLFFEIEVLKETFLRLGSVSVCRQTILPILHM